MASDSRAGAQLVVIVVMLMVALAGCDRPTFIILCHNANCAGPPDPSRDDTLETLQESLRLEHDGRPVLDGVELDIFWHGAANDGRGRCVFAHDIDAAVESVDASAAAEHVAAFMEEPRAISHNGERFYIRLELKGQVGSLGDGHSDLQYAQHAACALDLLSIFEAATERGERLLVVIFDSPEPIMLQAVTRDERWPGRGQHGRVQLQLSADFVDSMPTGLALQRLEDFPDVDDVVFHGGWISDGHYQAFRSLDLALTLWMFSATVETFGAIERLEPDAVLTSEAPLMRRWMSR